MGATSLGFDVEDQSPGPHRLTVLAAGVGPLGRDAILRCIRRGQNAHRHTNHGRFAPDRLEHVKAFPARQVEIDEDQIR
jgi:hypothetical protein